MNLEEANLEDGVLQLEQLEDALIHDGDDHVYMSLPTGPLLPRFHGSTPTVGASSSSIAVPQLPRPPSSSLPPGPPRGGPTPHTLRGGSVWSV